MNLSPGDHFAGYTIIRRLGRGGMGQVYLVENPALQRREALKVISAGAGAPADFEERFAREARTAASLHHPGIITVYAYGVEDETPWFTMHYLDGQDLSQTTLTDAEIADISRQSAAALDYAHKRGVIHRDIKPANIFLTRDEHQNIETVTLLDFGIAKLGGATGMTGTNMFIGTLNYGAPEVIDGRPPSPASDQYSFACTLYELLTGAPPFVADSPLTLLRAHGDKPAPPISSRRPDLAALDPIFARALAKNPADRYPTCRAFIDHTLRPGIPARTNTHRPASGPTPPPHDVRRPGPAAPKPPPRPATPPPPAPSPRAATPNPPAPTTPRPTANSGPTALGPAHAGTVAGRSRSEPTAGSHDATLRAATALSDSKHATDTDAAPAKRKRTRLILTAAIVAVILLAGGVTAYFLTKPDSPGLLSNVTDIATSGSTTCAIADGNACCWGDNRYGQLGDGSTTTNRNTPTRINGLPNPTAITTGWGTICAIADNNTYCWGNNEFGQLGDGTTTDRNTPTRIDALSNTTAITTGWGTTCAIADNNAYCWGNNNVGQLGNATTENRNTPTRINTLTNTTAITTRDGTTCAIADNNAYCWGNNNVGQLGNATTENRNTPTRINTLTNTTAITTSGYTTCAIADNNAYCWGNNEFGQLGNATTENRNTPTRINTLTNTTAITTGGYTTCAIADNNAYCWGNNSDGQLGNGNDKNRNSPTHINGLSNPTAITTSGSATCAIADNNTYCWGNNNRGQLGDGTTTNRTTPVPVRSP